MPFPVETNQQESSNQKPQSPLDILEGTYPLRNQIRRHDQRDDCQACWRHGELS